MSITLKSLLKQGEGDLSPLTMSDDQILEKIYATHVHSDIKFDVGSLFILVENILNRSTQIVDNVVQGTQPNIAQIEDKMPPASFSSPICTLKQVSCEMSCKPPGENVAHKTALSILEKLSHYPWDAKAVITLASFAMDYGEFWFLAQTQTADQLAKSIAILKRVPVITKPAGLQKYRQAVAELNNLIKACLQVIEIIFELEKMSIYDIKDVPALEPAMHQVPVDVYWAIITVVACTTQICCLTTESEKTQDLSHFGQKINFILSKLKKQLMLCKTQIEEAEFHRKLKKVFQTPSEVMEVFKLLIFMKETNVQPLFDGSSKTTVNIDLLRKKNVLLFISALDILEDDISVLRPIHESLKKDDQYKIVWIPIVEEWTDELKRKFEILKLKMPWYVVQNYTAVAGFRFIKEEWHFKGKPMVVNLNHQGKVQCQDAMHMIRVWGIKAFPFTSNVQETLSRESNWVGSVASNIHPSVTTWIKEEKYIFFYGGKDNEWLQQFHKHATALVNDAIIKESKISIEIFCVGKSGKVEEDRNILTRFWTGIESLFVTKVHKTVDPVTQEVQKLLSYKNESGWALLSKGSAVVLSGHGTTILKALEEFEKWKVFVSKKGFEFAFKEHHDKIVATTHRCLHLEIPNVAGKLPETITCPDCPRKMEIYISYKCCHNESLVNGAR